MKKWHALDVAQVMEELQTDPHLGLSEAEVKRRLGRYGLNELRKEEKVSLLILAFNQLKSILHYRQKKHGLHGHNRDLWQGQGSSHIHRDE